MLDRDQRSLLRQIFGVIGAASLLGCASRTVGDSDTGEGAGDSSSDESQSDSESSGGGLKFDVGGDESTDTGAPTTGVPETGGDPTDTDTGGDQCGPFIGDPWSVGSEPPPDWCGPLPDWGYAPVCFFPPDGTTCEDEPMAYSCIIDAYVCGLVSGGDAIQCGPYTTAEGACCYIVDGGCAVGRPFVVDGRARVAELRGGLAWAISGRRLARSRLGLVRSPTAGAPRPATRELDPTTRAALADLWRRHGASEHASIASFARFTSQLMALAAPARLIAASVAAGIDERRHALRCFGLASAYGEQTTPGALEVAAAFESSTPVDVAVSLASEGCVAETVSLMLLLAAHEAAEDQAVRACLAEMIDDERRHVLLAWEALAWMCARFGADVQVAVARVFGEAERHVGFGATTELLGDRASMRAHGCLPIPERRAVAVSALRELVLPSARALRAREGQPSHASPGGTLT